MEMGSYHISLTCKYLGLKQTCLDARVRINLYVYFSTNFLYSIRFIVAIL